MLAAISPWHAIAFSATSKVTKVFIQFTLYYISLAIKIDVKTRTYLI